MNKTKKQPKTQHQCFIDAAKELECDESEEAFEKALETLVPPKRGVNRDENDKED